MLHAQSMHITSDVRRASHAGDWYSANGKSSSPSISKSALISLPPGSELDSQLTAWLACVTPSDDAYPIKGCKAVIAPSEVTFTALRFLIVEYTVMLAMRIQDLLRHGHTRA
ncbi:hypothetical protein C0989_002262 [Termitomyces sp. Mn162]|nr:hypothetical protein C0989_002262 [Termitomyces sp. Mn162]